jgi:mannitol-specific phosphotransferase system IIBC component
MVFSDRYALYFDLVMMRPLDCIMMLLSGMSKIVVNFIVLSRHTYNVEPSCITLRDILYCHEAHTM